MESYSRLQMNCCHIHLLKWYESRFPRCGFFLTRILISSLIHLLQQNGFFSWREETTLSSDDLNAVAILRRIYRSTVF